MENKPIILAIKEVETEITNIVNKAGLPAFFLRYVFDRLEKDLLLIEQNELTIANEKYINENKEKEKE